MTFISPEQPMSVTSAKSQMVDVHIIDENHLQIAMPFACILCVNLIGAVLRQISPHHISRKKILA